MLAAVAPFARAGRRVDLAASDRASRRIVFTTITHPPARGLPALREQLDLLRKLGVKEAQGFLICKPMLAETLAHEDPEHGAKISPPVDKAVIDYRAARKAALKRRGGQAA